MFNPYHKLTAHLWNQCLDDKTPYLVSQTFKRGFSTYRKSNTTCVLLTPYTNFSNAWKHHQSLLKDPLAAFFHLNKPSHIESIERLLSSGTDYITYWGAIPYENVLLSRYTKNWELQIREYLLEYTGNHHQSLPPTSVNIEQQHGELVIHVSYGNKSWIVNLGEIEKEIQLSE